MSRPPFVVVGESLVDVVVAHDGTVSEAVGGSPMNVAVGLARLDVPSLLLTRIGDDAHGRAVAEHLTASGVRLAESSVVAGGRTSTATARLDARHAASYEFELAWELAAQALPEATGLHVGSLGAVLEPGRQVVLDLARQAERRELFVSFDPNVRPAFVTDRERAWADLCDLAGWCRLVKVSDEDLHVLRPGDDPDQLVGRLLAGPATELVVVTQGAQGAAARTEGFAVRVRAPAVEVVDTVGAGDAFMAAMLAILVEWSLVEDGPGALSALDEDRVALLLQGAVTAAALTCSRRGANPPTRRELPPTWPAG